ncbi:MAG TPA: hypothetical protein VER03_07115, partial [Bryobacteraceae bacterium]|nr:hypothetical protein [Bryobacteraceae bacterium]
LEVEMFHQQPEVDEDYTEITPEARAVLTLLGNHDDIRATAALLFRYGSTARRAYTAAFKTLRDLQGDRFNRQPATTNSTPISVTGTNQSPSVAPVDQDTEPAAPAAVHASRITHVRSVVLIRRSPVAATKNRKLQNEPKHTPEIAAVAGRNTPLTLLQAS